MSIRFSALFFLLPSLALAQPPSGYYDPAAGLSGEPLRQALYGIINGHTVISNSMLWEAYYETDRKPDNTVWDMYSDVPGGTPPYVYQFVVDQCGTYDEEGDCFNREHSFPQSWFSSAAPMTTDLFHIYPTDGWVNQKRGNWPYGEVNAPTWTSENGGKLGPCALPACSGTVFEPIDAYKGDLARGYFYMLTRYLPDLNGWPCPMMADGEFLPWAEAMLVNWHLQDPVSPKEIARNNAVFGIQDNRNPYIDHPEWVTAIWGPEAGLQDLAGATAGLWWDGAQLHLRNTLHNETYSLAMIDATGRTVGTWPVRGDATDIALPEGSGIFLITLQGGGLRSTLRLVR